MPASCGLPADRVVSSNYIIEPTFPDFTLKSLPNHREIPILRSHVAETESECTGDGLGSGLLDELLRQALLDVPTYFAEELRTSAWLTASGETSAEMLLTAERRRED